MPNAIQMLKQDHKKVANLFQKYHKAKSQEAKRNVADQAMGLLEIHTKLEEEIFYPAARNQLEDGQLINEALREHDTVKDLIEVLRAMTAEDESFDQKWFELVENVQHHVEEEEGELLPLVQDSALDLAQTGEEMAERKEELEEETGIGKSHVSSTAKKSPKEPHEPRGMSNN